MRAMRLHSLEQEQRSNCPLTLDRVAVPRPGTGEVLVRVSACGVCHTELDEIEGRTPPPHLPVIPGHQATGRIVEEGPGCELGLAGRLVGIAWIRSSCGRCQRCLEGRENLCPDFVATGRDADGGYAEFVTAPEQFVHPIPEGLSPVAAAPLLCAGAVGYRALRMCGLTGNQALGLTGFGASGQLVIRMARHLLPDLKIAVFARNPGEREHASSLGAQWAGDTEVQPPFPLDAIIDTTPAWKPIRCALAALAAGGRLVVNAIRKEDGDQRELLKLRYETHLWQEKRLQSVANVTRDDVRECLDLAARIGLVPAVDTVPLADANTALAALRQGGLLAAKVLTMR